MSDYTNAPATTMLATHCAVCATPLLDAISVETGIGPTCRAKHGYNVKVEPEKRAEANGLVYQIAIEQTGPGVAKACARLTELGFDKLSARIIRRVAAVEIGLEGNLFVVKSEFSENAVIAMRSVPGRRWDGERKVNTFPTTSREQLWAALKRAFPGRVAVGPKGPFTLTP